MSVTRFEPGSVMSLGKEEVRLLRTEDLDKVEIEIVATGDRKIMAASTLKPQQDAVADAPDLILIDEKAWEIARAREAIIRPLSQMPARTRKAVREAGGKLHLGVNQTYTLPRRYLESPRLTSLLPRKPGIKAGRKTLDPRVEAVIEAAIEDYYATRRRPKLQDLIEEIARRCKRAELDAPARNTVARRIRVKDPARMIRRRHSRRRALAAQPAPGIFPGADSPLAVVQIDHTLVDVIVVDERSGEPIGRPWLTVAIDVHSRMVAGFHLSLLAPSATSVALALVHAVMPKNAWLDRLGIEAPWPVSGLMKVIHVDNAKEFRSEAFTRGCRQYGITVEYRPVATPHYGGHIERLIGTLMGKVHLLPGTTWSSVAEKGDARPDETACLTLKDLEAWLALQIADIYHRRRHRGTGETPLDRWERGILGARGEPGAGLPPRIVDEHRFLIDFLPACQRQVRRQGIVWDHIWYWSDALRPFVGEGSVLVRRDPRDLSRIHVVLPNGGGYLEAPYSNLTRPPVSLWEHQRAMARLQQEGARHFDEEAIFRAVAKQRRIEDEASARQRSARKQRATRPGKRQASGSDRSQAASSPVAQDETGPAMTVEPDEAISSSAFDQPREKRRFVDLRRSGARQVG